MSGVDAREQRLGLAAPVERRLGESSLRAWRRS